MPQRAPGTIRAARATDAPVLREIEVRAGERFRDVGMPDIADAEPMAEAELVAYVREGRAWVVVGGDDQPLGYVVVDVLDGAGHIEQLSVEPGQQGQGWGRALIEQVATWAAAAGLTGLTLTTFDQVPWNRPLYEHLGFRVLAEHEVTPGLLGRRAHEASLGLDPAERVCMARAVATGR